MVRKRANLDKYIVKFAYKHDLDSKLLFDALIRAWKHEKATYGVLRISCRGTREDSASFLITNEEKVVSQFRIKLDVLKNPEPFLNKIQIIARPRSEKRKITSKLVKIGDLKLGMKGINVKAKIIDIPPKRLVTWRSGSQAYVSNVIISDGTGTVRLGLWNRQIGKFHAGDNINVKNCSVFTLEDELHLRRKKTGLISALDKSPVQCRTSRSTLKRAPHRSCSRG